jgi:ABC-type uncharacterized transport system substrate-binding protein
MREPCRGATVQTVAPDPSVSENRRGPESAHGGDGMIRSRAALIVVLAVRVLLAPVTAEAQRPGGVATIGVLCVVTCDGPGVEAFRRTLRDLGRAEDRTVTFEYRAAEANVARLDALANDLVRAGVDVIVTTWGTGAPLAAKRATTRIPIVMIAAGDPVKAGIVPSLAKPGANVTGFSSLALVLEAKRLEVLKELVPNVATVGVFWDPDNSYSAMAIEQEQNAARTLGLRLKPVVLRTPSDLETAFAALRRARADALSVHGYVATLKHRASIVRFAARNRLPAIYPFREYAIEGGLMSYGANVVEISRRAADYVDRILKGAKPGALPVEQPTTFELVVNLKTARALNVTIPASLLLRADQVIE